MNDLKWTMGRLSLPGYYAYRIKGQWPLYFGMVSRGDWRLSQNPEHLYLSGSHSADSVIIADLVGENVMWYGPLPNCPVWEELENQK